MAVVEVVEVVSGLMILTGPYRPLVSVVALLFIACVYRDSFSGVRRANATLPKRASLDRLSGDG